MGARSLQSCKNSAQQRQSEKTIIREDEVAVVMVKCKRSLHVSNEKRENLGIGAASGFENSVAYLASFPGGAWAIT